MFLAKAYVFPDQNDFGDHEGVNQRSSIGEIRDLELVEQQQAIGRYGAEEKGEVYKDYGKFLKLVSSLLFEAGLTGIFITRALPFPSDRRCRPSSCLLPSEDVFSKTIQFGKVDKRTTSSRFIRFAWNKSIILLTDT
jgi:hypothetical protein